MASPPAGETAPRAADAVTPEGETGPDESEDVGVLEPPWRPSESDAVTSGNARRITL
jgi:hypothetical protein